MTIEEIMRTAPVIPVLVVDRLEDAVPMAEALVAGGLRVLEVTLRTPVALDAIRAMREVDGAIVGAGTVVDQEQLQAAIDAGAQFIVSPGLTEALGLSLPGNGSTLATHADRERLFREAGHLIVDITKRYYEQDDESVLPRSIASYEVHTTGGIGYQKRVGFQEVEREQSRSVELCAVEVHACPVPDLHRFRDRDGDLRLALRYPRQPVRLQLLATALCQRKGCQYMGTDKRHRRDGIAELLGHSGGIEHCHPEPVMLLGNHHSPNADFAQRRTHVVAEGNRALRAFAHMIERTSISKSAADRVAEHLLVLRKSEIHQAAPLFCPLATAVACSAAGGVANLGSRGISSPRSAMMFFWIWAVPPPMIRPSWNM